MIKTETMILNGKAAEEAAAVYNLLPEKIKARVDTKKRFADRIRTLGCLALLGNMLKDTKFSLDDLYYNENGKPLIDGIYISLAHKGEMCVCSVADRAVGTDVEKVVTVKNNAPKFFLEREREYAGRGAKFFFEVWTKKEAAAKLSGLGIKGFSGIDIFSSKYKFEVKTINEYMITTCVLAD